MDPNQTNILLKILTPMLIKAPMIPPAIVAKPPTIIAWSSELVRSLINGRIIRGPACYMEKLFDKMFTNNNISACAYCMIVSIFMFQKYNCHIR